MTATLRTQRARSRQAQSGAKRVEVVLDARELEIVDGMIQTLGPAYGYKDRASAIRQMIRR
jgi:hypothetical protein